MGTGYINSIYKVGKSGYEEKVMKEKINGSGKLL